MKKLVLMFSFCLFSASFLFAQHGPVISMDVIIGNRPPAPNEMRLMKVEENNHPNVAKAMHGIERSMKFLHDAPDDFGGHKAQAESDLKQAYISLRKALYFHLYDGH
ncbi:MAG TPA: hypothetical protein VIJ75_09565 [Hanamia sp.]